MNITNGQISCERITTEALHVRSNTNLNMKSFEKRQNINFKNKFEKKKSFDAKELNNINYRKVGLEIKENLLERKLK